jgi:hypothetical protein
MSQIAYVVRCSVVANEICYAPEGRGFETQSVELFLSFYLYLILPNVQCPWVYSASNRNE